MPQPKRKPPPPPPEEKTETAEAPPTEEMPSPEKRQRSVKFRRIESAVEGIYIMLGGGLTTLPMVNPRTKAVGMSLARSSEEIAEAWVDLAEEDKRVCAILEQFISFSGWGKVIGVHAMVIGAGVPGITAARQPQGQQRQPNPGAAQDTREAFAMAEMLRQMASESRMEQPNGQEQQQQPTPPEQPPQVRRQPTNFRPRAGMPSPADLGATVSDIPETFPASGSESVKGG